MMLILLVLVTSCGTENAPAQFEIDERLIPYYELFLSEAADRGRDLVIPYSFIIDFNHYIDGSGVTRTHKNGLIEIYIHSTDWYRWNDYEREYIMFHEFSHAILKRGHIKNDMSIMTERLYPSLTNYRTNREEMLQELFR